MKGVSIFKLTFYLFTQVLGTMLTLPRLLTLQQRHLGKMVELYLEHEIAYIRAHVKQEAVIPSVPRLFEGSLLYMAQPRLTKARNTSNVPVFPRRFCKKDIVLNMVSIIALVID